MKAKLIKDFSENSYIYNIDEKPDQSGLHFQMQFTGYEEIGHNYRLERQDMPSFMMTLVLKGSFHLLLDKQYYRVPEGSLCFLDCMRPHKTWVTENYTIIYIHVFHPLLGEFHRYITSLASPVIPLDGDKIGFFDCVTKIHETCKNGEYDSDLTSSLLYGVLLKLKKHVESGTLSLPTVPDYINELIGYIEKHYTEDCSLSTLAKTINFSPNYLDMVFKKYTGSPLARYVSMFRLKKCQTLLITTQKSISEIAVDVGFSDSQTLIRKFKQVFNLTPLQYRLQYRS